MNSTRSTDFITPKTRVSRHFRNAVLDLAREHPFARKLVNSGRLSVPAYLTQSALNTPDTDAFAGDMVPGAPMDDAPVATQGQAGWLLRHLGQRFQCLYFVDDPATLDAATLGALQGLRDGAIPIEPLLVAQQPGTAGDLPVLHDVDGLVARRYDARPGTVYLSRPDQHVAARWRLLDSAALRPRLLAALARATCNA